MRIPVPLRQSYRLLNHGPSTLISAAHDGARNVMAAAWVMPLDFEPAKLCAVIGTGTRTRELVDLSGEFVVNVPCAAQVDLTWYVGSHSGSEVDKFAAKNIATSPATQVKAPLIEGCLAWLECRVISEPSIQSSYDLFVAEVVAAFADDEYFRNAEYRVDDPAHRTLHHVAKGVFFTPGARIDAKG